MTDYTQGVLMYAFNNTEIDYVQMAVVNAYMVRHHMNTDCALVTDSISWQNTCEHLGADYCEDAFVKVIITEKNTKFKYSNIRSYRDTVHKKCELSFYNAGRSDAYQLSPFDETILIDADYLVLGDSLNLCWGHTNNIMINHTYTDVYPDRSFLDTNRLNNLGVDMYWATVVYFRKSTEAELWFALLQNVTKNYAYYHNLYNCDNNLFRNDYVFSIASHMFMGFSGAHLPELPVKLFNSFDRDTLHSIKALDEVVMAIEKPGTDGDFVLGSFKYNNVHIMNKWALGRISAELSGMLEEAHAA